MTVKLSAVLIVKNESKILERCLKSLEGVDEIVICDTGSSDNTVEIATKYTDKVFTDFVWCDDFAKARNHAKSKATNEWILSIDADEFVEPGGIAKIKQAIEAAPEGCKSLSVTMLGENSTNVHQYPRVFHNSCVWAGAIHEAINSAAKHSTGVTITYGFSPAHLLDPDIDIRILQKQVEKNPKSTRDIYYLAREYWYKRNFQVAALWYQHYLTIGFWKPERADAYLMLARCKWHMGEGEEARTNCLQALNLNANFKEAALFMAEISWESNARVWKAMAEAADNSDVLFIRT
jgi:glycosyltransferase involved in cell wall biosynthesis